MRQRAVELKGCTAASFVQLQPLKPEELRGKEHERLEQHAYPATRNLRIALSSILDLAVDNLHEPSFAIGCSVCL